MYIFSDHKNFQKKRYEDNLKKGQIKSIFRIEKN
jgi:hypothetical protein